MAGLPEIEIPGCAEGCEHVWGEVQPEHHPGQVNQTKWAEVDAVADGQTAGSGQYCQLCSGWRGCLGLEPTVEMFVGHIVLVWRALWRVMRDDAVCWLNFGDSYASAPQADNHADPKAPRRVPGGRCRTNQLKPKDLIGIPWRVAFALQADGWYLRSSIIWAKGISFCPTWSGSCMPESTKDRPTKSYENVFLLAKSKKYFYDGVAVRENASMDSGFAKQRLAGNHHQRKQASGFVNDASSGSAIDTWTDSGKRNLRSVWTINPGSYAGAHFATFPPKLVEPMIRAGTSQRGCCPKCLSPWVRVVERKQGDNQEWAQDANPSEKETALIESGGRCGHGKLNRGSKADYYANAARHITTGWRPTCSCSGLTIIGDQPAKPSRKKGQSELSYTADLTAWQMRLNKWHQHWDALKPLYDAEPTVPCTVLDPFAGTFTTGKEAIRLGRHAVGIELSKTYCDDHIIPRLSEPLFEWAQEQAEQDQWEPEPEIEQLGLL